MGLNVDNLIDQMVQAGKTLTGSIWATIETYAIPELRKIAQQIVNIQAAMATPKPPYTHAGAKALLDMQITAAVGVVVAATALGEIAVQQAINTILSAIAGVVNQAIKFPLLG